MSRLSRMVAIRDLDEPAGVWHLAWLDSWPLAQLCGETTPDPMRRRCTAPGRLGVDVVCETCLNVWGRDGAAELRITG